MEYEKMAKKHRKKMVLDLEAASMQNVSYDKEYVKNLIPHRDPFLLIDGIDAVDLEQRGIVGNRTINPEDPIFAGHFPDYAIYPGVLQVEMIGQLAICYYAFEKAGTIKLKEFSELGVRALKIYHTLWQHEVLPNDTVKILGKVMESDDYTFKGIGQVVKDDKVCAVAIAEFYIV